MLYYTRIWYFALRLAYTNAVDRRTVRAVERTRRDVRQRITANKKVEVGYEAVCFVLTSRTMMRK